MAREIYKKYPDMRFCKILNKSKIPYETEWQKNPYEFKDVSSDSNIGILTGHGDIAIIDVDEEHIIANLNGLIDTNTLIARSGSGNGYHIYYKVRDPKELTKNKYIMHDGSVHVGEILWNGCQAVGIGSIHPSGNPYELLQDLPILEVSAEELENVADYYTKPDKKIEYDQKDQMSSVQTRTSDILKTILNNEKITHELTLKENIQKNNVLFKNMAIFLYFNEEYTEKIEAFVYGCGHGMAEFEGWLKKAPNMSINEKELKDWIVEYDLTGIIYNEDNYNGLEITNEAGVLDWTESSNFLIKNLIYENTVNMIFAPPASFKSFFSLYMSMCLASGKEFMGMETKQVNVLYLDKENPKVSYKNRYRGLLKGTGFKTTNNLFTYKAGDILDDGFILSLKATIKKYNIKVVVLDTLHRFGSYNEDKADDLNEIYMKTFQPLAEDYGCSIIFLHHTTKAVGANNYRGSSDLEGMCDGVLSFERIIENKVKTNKVVLKHQKNRHGSENDPMYFELDIKSDENDKIEYANFRQFESDAGSTKTDIIKNMIVSKLRDGPISRAEMLTYMNGQQEFSMSLFDKILRKLKADEIMLGDAEMYKLNKAYKKVLG